MERVRDFRSPSLLQVSSFLGDQLLNLYHKDCPSSAEFQYLGYEVKSFHASYQIVRPYLHAPLHLVSEDGVRLIRNIHDGIESICEDINIDTAALQEDLDQASRAHHRQNYAWFALHHGRPTVRNRDKRMKEFLSRKGRYDLERCQLRYGNALLRLVLVVLVYVQNIHYGDGNTFTDHSRYLVEDLHAARQEIQVKERRTRRARQVRMLPVEVYWWWEGLHENLPNAQTLNPLESLANVWINPAGRFATQPSPDVQGLRDRLRQWQEYSQQQETNFNARIQQTNNTIHALEIDNTQLRQTVEQSQDTREQLQRDKDNLQGTIDRLHDRISRLADELQNSENAVLRSEERTDRYRSQRNSFRDQLSRQSTQIGVVELPARPQHPGYEAHNSTNHVRTSGSSRRREGSRESTRVSSQPENSSQGHRAPPVSYNTHRRHHHRSSSSTPSEQSSNAWSRATTETQPTSIGSSGPPSINFSRRPFQSTN